jgi:hypothetical protein
MILSHCYPQYTTGEAALQICPLFRRQQQMLAARPADFLAGEPAEGIHLCAFHGFWGVPPTGLLKTIWCTPCLLICGLSCLEACLALTRELGW